MNYETQVRDTRNARALVGRNSGPVFHRLWTKVHQIKSALQFAVPFSVRRYLVSLWRYSRSSCEAVRNLYPNFDFWDRQFIFFWGGGQISDPIL